MLPKRCSRTRRTTRLSAMSSIASGSAEPPSTDISRRIVSGNFEIRPERLPQAVSLYVLFSKGTRSGGTRSLPPPGRRTARRPARPPDAGGRRSGWPPSPPRLPGRPWIAGSPPGCLRHPGRIIPDTEGDQFRAPECAGEPDGKHRARPHGAQLLAGAGAQHVAQASASAAAFGAGGAARDRRIPAMTSAIAPPPSARCGGVCPASLCAQPMAASRRVMGSRHRTGRIARFVA